MAEPTPRPGTHLDLTLTDMAYGGEAVGRTPEGVVFAWGGMGQFIAGSVLDKDYPVIQGGVLMFAIIFVLVNLLVDMLYAVIDPRIRVS